MRRPLLLALLLSSCAPAADPVTATPARPPLLPATPRAAADAEPMPAAAARLPDFARPLRYSLELDVDPGRPTFSGKATILVRVTAPTSHLVLHARGPKVGTATVTTSAGAQPATVTTRPSPGSREDDQLVVSLPHPLAPGDVTLTIAYEAPFADTLSGLYRVRDGGLDYAFTQFESTDARRAFPCFDEPGFKTPYEVAVRVPAGMIAVSNGAETKRETAGGKTTLRFATTPPLPAYLVALAVGDLEIVQGATAPTPIRLVTTKGKSALGKASLEVTRLALASLEGYFGIKYPYEKLDVVAVPDFGAGAMENAGLVTFREELLLLGDKPSVRARRAQTSVIAHELAHQWFGDLVTMAWWDDLWLNEGFATWMQTRVMAELDKDFHADLEAASSAEGVKDADGLASARAIRQPVATSDEAMEAFDGITYQKGAAVLRMLEHFAGAEPFRAGVREYLKSHAYGTARADDLLTALATAAGKPELPAIASTFLDRPGVPVIEQSGACAATADTFRLELSQTRAWRPLGGAVSEEARWRVPVCPAASGGASTCLLLEPGKPIAASGQGKCPAALDSGAFAYARTSLTPQAIADLARAYDHAGGAPVDRLAFLANLWADVRGGHQSVKTLLEALPIVDHETTRAVVEELVTILYGVRDALLEPAARASFRTYALARLAPHKARLAAATDEESELLGRTLAYALVELAEDAPTQREEDALARAWLKDRRGVDPDRAQAAVELFGRRATPADAERLRALVLDPQTAPQDRVTALRGAMGSENPALLRGALDWALANAKVQDYRYVFYSAYAHHDNRPLVVAWVKEHFDALRAKLPGPLGSGLVGNVGMVCSRAELDNAKAFFEPKLPSLEGAARRYAESLETANLCVALRDARAPELTKALGAPPPAAKPNKKP